MKIPDLILKHFNNDLDKASSNCLLLPLSPLISVSDAAWLCHDDLQTIFKFQDILSKRIRDMNNFKYFFVADYIQGRSQRLNGLVSLDSNGLKFTPISENGIILNNNSVPLLDIKYSEIQPYAVSLFLKETLLWQGLPQDKPEESRCLRIQRIGLNFINSPDYFCIFYQRDDFYLKFELPVVQACFQAELYTQKINRHLQNSALNLSLQKLQSINILNPDLDNELLNPVKIQIREEFYVTKYKLYSLFKVNTISRNDYELRVDNAKEKIINSVCNGVITCINSMKYLSDKGLLPTDRSKFSLDPQNPYNTLIPKTNLKINLPKAGNLGKKLLENIVTANNLDSKYNRNRNLKIKFEPLPQSAPGELPNPTLLILAFNTLQFIRSQNKPYTHIEQFQKNCRLNALDNELELKRKVSLLSYVGQIDTFMDYLGDISYNQNNKK